MGRRKRAFLDDGDSDSSPGSELDETPGDFDDADPDARAERELFENPYRHKRRRPNAKEDALYGVFAEDSEDEGFGRKKQKAEPSKRRDWAKAPAFVSSKMDIKETTELDVEMQMEVEEEGEENGGEEEEIEEDESEPSRAPSPRVREEEEEEEEEEAEKPRFGGLGLGASKTKPPISFSGFTKSGIGAFRPAATSQSPVPSPAPAQPTALPPDLPSAFGASSRTQRAFVRDNAGSSETSRAATPLPATEQRHFSKLQSTFGARMLAKMGWQAGTGLGVSGAGIVTPVETKVRPKNMGIAFRGFTERTAQAKLEAKRRGEAVSEDEEEMARKPGRGKAKAGEQAKKSDAWKKPKKVKTKVVYKTYEEIVAEAGQEAGTAGVGIIIDATGATPREVASLAEVSTASWTPSTEAERIPEVRHNLRLIVDAAKGDLDALAREAKEIQQRRAVIQAEDLRLRKKVEEEAELISRLQQVHLVVDDIKSQARELSSVYEATLEPFSPHFEKLLSQYPQEFERYRLDEIVVAAIAPIVRRMLSQWSPLEDPNALLATFRRWRKALKLSDNEQKAPGAEIDVYGGRIIREVAPVVEVPMTPFESLLWNAWLPKVRSAINNDWDPRDPQPAVQLYETWSTFLPPFIRDNFLDQLILPKVSRAVADWNRKETVSLKTLVFPWLPHVGLRLEDVLDDARRKLKGILRSWTATDAIPQDLATWREVFNAGDWDAMLLKYIVPKLGATLREDFSVNPRQQDMAPLRRVLDWEPLLRPSILAQLLESGFFPKWLDVLHIWLTQPRPSFEEVAQWYAYWKSVFSESVQNLPAVKDGFTRGLQLMNKAIELGPDAPTKLPKPDHHRRRDEQVPALAAAKAKKVPARVQEITFRSIVEDFAASHNLMFVPTGRAHELSRMPLFRVSPTADGKGGVLVYILDDAVWAPNAEGDYRAISLETMALRATKGGA